MRLALMLCPVLLMALAGPVVAGAKEEVIAAGRKMLALRSYHVTMTHGGPRAMTSEVDFVAPDRYRMKMPMGTQTIIGDTITMQIDGRTMRMPMRKGMVSQWRDPANLARNEAKLQVTALGSEPVEGKPARKYRIASADTPGTVSTMWVGADGYPLRIVVDGKSKDGAGTTTIRYSRFNDPTIQIAAP